jgi:hypothetical protein
LGHSAFAALYYQCSLHPLSNTEKTKKMTETELKKQIEYWEEIYNNCKSRDERELYLKIYTSLNEILSIWTRENRFVKE